MLRLGAVLLALVTTGAPALAACLSDAEVRAKVARGEAQPLAQVATAAQALQGGRVIGAQLCQSGSALVYRLKIMTAAGQVRLVTADAHSGQFLSAQ